MSAPVTNRLRSATALVTGLALVLPPNLAVAQGARAEERKQFRVQCQDAGLRGPQVQPCVRAFLEGADGIAIGLEAGAGEGAADEVVEEAIEAVEAEAEAAADAVEEVIEEVAPETAEDPAAEEPAEEIVVEEAPAEEAPAEAVVVEEAPVEEVEEAPVEEVVVEEVPTEEAPAEEVVVEEAPAEAPVEEVVAEEAPAEAPAEEVVAEEAPVEVPAEEEAPVEEVAEDLAAPNAADSDNNEALEQALEAEAEAEADAQAETAVSDDPEAAGETAGTAETAAPEAPAIPESAAAAEVAARPEPKLNEAQQTARDQAQSAIAALDAQTGTGDPAAAAAPAAAAGAAPEAAPDAQITEETVSEAQVRRSSQDFATDAVVTNDDDDGISDVAKIALGALGGLAVGTLLNNRSRVVSNSGDRVVVQRADGDLTVLKDDDALLRQAGSNVRTERFDDGSTRTTVTREDGSQIVTIRDASLRVLRRTRVEADGTRYVLIDDTETVETVDVSVLPAFRPVVSTRDGDDALRAALQGRAQLDRRFSLAQVRGIPEVRSLAPAIEVAAVTFASGSAAIQPDQAEALTDLAQEMLRAIGDDPREVFLIEGHTDAVGDAAYNLALSDRRAETLALALNEYFQVPVENMVVQGYGERFLKVQTQTDERANRRAVARRITGLLQVAAAN